MGEMEREAQQKGMEATRAIGGDASPGAGGERDTIEGREPNQTPDREKEVARIAKAVDRSFGLSKPHLRTEIGVAYSGAK